ncbi:hypothetical protein BDV97DRAFT_378364 [Delphinella strobiligena]|nr:hypothetical protein BDV97DRAFT_378364 [Delphinella strobiligena]
MCSSIKSKEATFHTVLLPLALTANEIASVSQYVRLFEGVSSDPDVRAAASEATRSLDEYHAETSMREDIFALVQNVVRDNPSALDPEDRRYLEKTYESFLRHGVGLEDDGKRERIKEVKMEIDECIRVFMRNLREQDAEIWFSVEELDGVSVATIDGLEASADGDARRLTFKAPDVKAILKSARAEETRKRVYMGDDTVAEANVAVFKQCVVLRDELARLLGYSSFVEYAFQERMAGSKKGVEAFLDDLHASLKEGPVEHIKRLQAMKSRDLYSKNRGQEVDTDKFYIWDVAYYNEKLMKESYEVDQARIAEYFPAQLGFTDREGKRHHVSTALICNLSYPTPTRPSLLQHRQVITLFHEVGHAMHDLLSRTKYARFHGHEVARDFVEMPSQMLEHWCWIPSVLRSMSRHYSYLSLAYRQTWLDEHPDAYGILPPERIPEEMVDSLVKAKNVTVPLEQMRQIALAKFDLGVYGQSSAHDTAALNPSHVFNRTKADLGLVPGPETMGQGYDWGHGYVRTSHFIWGNEACYYGYLFFQVFSADLYHSMFEENPLDSEVGRRYRHMVLEKGGSQDEMKTLIDFLGREPSVEAFRKELGV